MLLLADNFTAGNPSKDRVLKLSYMERKNYDFRGDRASSLRGELGWTLKELANAVGKIMGREVGEAQLSLIENGKRSPSLSLSGGDQSRTTGEYGLSLWDFRQ